MNIHSCKDCGTKIYYKPEFVGLNIMGHSGYATSFKKMNLDKTAHKCAFDPAMDAVNKAENRFEEAIGEANRWYWNDREEYHEGFDFPR